MSEYKKYSLKEIATHNTSNNCWVIINGAVIDVSSFLAKHPGGVSAICQPGRAGSDVTIHFKKIGHSANAKSILKSLQIGVVCNERDEEIPEENSENTPLLEDSLLVEKLNHKKEYASNWHAIRRRAILRDHPEVKDLIGSNHWTCLIGIFTVLIHCLTCLYVQLESTPWYYSFILAYSVGAICKMYQFAINHDICHDTAGIWLQKSDLLKRSAMQLFTLPGFGGTMHTYYEFQHVGHHASLGAQSLEDLVPIVKNGLFTAESLRQAIFFPDGDGDLLAVGTLSLGRILQHWKSASKMKEADIEENILILNDRVYAGGKILQKFHMDYKLFKCLAVIALHLNHHFAMTLLFLEAIIIPPFIALPAFIFPDYVSALVLSVLKTVNNGGDSRMTSETMELFIQTSIRVFGSVGLHTWLWVGLNWWLLIASKPGLWSIVSISKGLIYLYLSELFLYGFCFHPFMGYFLGTHRSQGGGFEQSKKEHKRNVMADLMETAGYEIHCQPTMSTYCWMASLASLNLTYHVEHHDFPGVPWNRLPMIKKMAPEYYECLEQSPGFCTTIYRWINYSGSWGYACH